MENQNQNNQINEINKPKSKFWKFALIFAGIVIFTIGGFLIWGKYLSPQAKYQRETQKNYEKYLAWEKNYEKAMTEDTYGGKTPEETLQMFIEALKKEDIELASKYFTLNTNEKSEYYLTKRQWEDGLKKAKEEKKIEGIVFQLLKSKLTFKNDEGALFKSYNPENEVDVLVEIKLNKYSNVWKIESL